MAPSINENKQRMADEINAILKTKIHWEKLSMEDLGSIYAVVSSSRIDRFIWVSGFEQFVCMGSRVIVVVDRDPRPPLAR